MAMANNLIWTKTIEASSTECSYCALHDIFNKTPIWKRFLRCFIGWPKRPTENCWEARPTDPFCGHAKTLDEGKMKCQFAYYDPKWKEWYIRYKIRLNGED